MGRRMTRAKRIIGLARRLWSAREGGVAMIYAIALPVVVLMAVAGVDLHRATSVRMNLQDALDAATLAAARAPDADSDEEVQAVGMAALRANLEAYPEVALREDMTTFDLVDSDTIQASAKVDVTTLVANIFLPPYGEMADDVIQVGTTSEVKRSTTDLEVAMVLDITGSMAGTRLSDLKVAAKDLVDLVVKGNQEVNKTRVALIPYSMGVNAGDYADDVRGALAGPTSITAASWWASGSSSKNISDVSNASSAEVTTSNNHGLDTGDYVWIEGVESDGWGSSLADRVNERAYRVVKVSNRKFTLQHWNGSSWSNFSTSSYDDYDDDGTVRECRISTCEVVVTSANHGLQTGDQARILDVRGMTQVNNRDSVSGSNLYHTVTRQSASTFSLDGVEPDEVSTYDRNGSVQCLEQGCARYYFVNAEGNDRVYWATDCVTERVGGDAYTNVAASSALVGLHYSGESQAAYGGCMQTTITPLSSDKDDLKSKINDYSAEGGTSGHIGTAWGWYALSPAFASIFPEANRPDPYGTHGLQKILILMTDGEFNTGYCRGVNARDSGEGSGAADHKINCDATNGSPFTQAVSLCEAAKAEGVIIYTVGFAISSARDWTPNTIDTAQEVMQACATDSSKVYLPENGAALKTSFKAIGKSISELRISS